MDNFTQSGSIKLHGRNALQKMEIDSSMTIASYEAIKDILVVGGISVISAVDRMLVPIDEQVRGVGSSKEYREGKIFLPRANQGTACVTGLIPKDDTERANLKVALMALTFQGEKPTGVTFQTN